MIASWRRHYNGASPALGDGDGPALKFAGHLNGSFGVSPECFAAEQLAFVQFP